MDYLDEMEADELRAQDSINRRHQRILARHPDCRDPDHPGCPLCDDDEEEIDGEEE